MNFFGLIFACSCLGSLLYSASLFKLPDLWAGGFLVKTAANLDDFASTVKVNFNEVDRSVFQNPARLLTHSAIASAQITSVQLSPSSSNSPLRDGQRKTDFARSSVRPATKFLQFEPIPDHDPAIKLISAHINLQSAAISTDGSEQNQTSRAEHRLHNSFGSSTTSLIFSSRYISWGRSFLPQEYVIRTTLKRPTPTKTIRVRQGQRRREFLFQVWVNDTQVAEFLEQAQADLMAQQLRQILYGSSASTAAFDWNRLQPARTNGLPSGKVGSTVLFVVSEPLAKLYNRSSDLIAIDWINRLRVALDAKPLPLVEAQTQMYGLKETEKKLEGTASWYGPYFHGRLTATGEIFNQGDLTAAHPSLPFNTFLKVTNLVNGKSVIVRINDRGPYVGDRSLDLSREAAHYLGGEQAGIISYRALIMAPHRSEVSASDVRPTSVDHTLEQAIATAYDLAATRSSEPTSKIK